MKKDSFAESGFFDDPYFAKLFFSGKKKPPVVLANEYEDNLYDYSRCIYEIQMLIPQE